MKKLQYKKIVLFLWLQSSIAPLVAQQIKTVKTYTVDNGWAGNSINTVVFRKNSLCSYKNTQYISYYNQDGYVVLGKRTLGTSKWMLQTTQFKGNITDAHNSISIITDGDGYLHMSWNMHNVPLHYSKSIAPGSLQMTEEMSMTGISENSITYPEFYSLPDGNLLFFFRNGRSGGGNLVINHYDIKTKKWKQVHQNFIDGEGRRNAYWQACVDKKGTIHISWVWRESSDVASNHDLCYAQSPDGGLTWQKSNREKYSLPINASTAEYICRIPQKSELINQTSMCTDEEGKPFIASYWRDQGDSVPQYHIIYKEESVWKQQNTGFRHTGFNLSGMGTKRIPVSRPQIVTYKKANTNVIALIFRDEERGDKVSIAINKDSRSDQWEIKDVTSTSVGSWEPSYDIELWKEKKQLSLFVQLTDQKDSEGKSEMAPQMVKVLDIKIK